MRLPVLAAVVLLTACSASQADVDDPEAWRAERGGSQRHEAAIVEAASASHWAWMILFVCPSRTSSSPSCTAA